MRNGLIEELNGIFALAEGTQKEDTPRVEHMRLLRREVMIHLQIADAALKAEHAHHVMRLCMNRMPEEPLG